LTHTPTNTTGSYPPPGAFGGGSGAPPPEAGRHLANQRERIR
jgi:hypothetical protein